MCTPSATKIWLVVEQIKKKINATHKEKESRQRVTNMNNNTRKCGDDITGLQIAL